MPRLSARKSRAISADYAAAASPIFRRAQRAASAAVLAIFAPCYQTDDYAAMPERGGYPRHKAPDIIEVRA